MKNKIFRIWCSFGLKSYSFGLKFFCSFLTRRKSMSNHDSRDETVRQELRLDNQFSAVNQQSVYHLFFSSNSSTLLFKTSWKIIFFQKYFRSEFFFTDLVLAVSIFGMLLGHRPLPLSLRASVPIRAGERGDWPDTVLPLLGTVFGPSLLRMNTINFPHLG